MRSLMDPGSVDLGGEEPLGLIAGLAGDLNIPDERGVAMATNWVTGACRNRIVEVREGGGAGAMWGVVAGWGWAGSGLGRQWFLCSRARQRERRCRLEQWCVLAWSSACPSIVFGGQAFREQNGLAVLGRCCLWTCLLGSPLW
jgi:hypothetical protein